MDMMAARGADRLAVQEGGSASGVDRVVVEVSAADRLAVGSEVPVVADFPVDRIGTTQRAWNR
jgi:hypothetical protein